MQAKISMKCYFDLCVYQNDNACTLDIEGMEINSLGMCERCEVVMIDDEVLAGAKQKRLDEIAEIWKGDCNSEGENATTSN